MDSRRETYKRLITEIIRLKGNKDTAHELVDKYILKKVSDTALLAALKKSKEHPPTIKLPQALQSEEILLQTTKILTLMEVSENWEEFEKLNDKKDQSAKPKEDKEERQLTDFDKILKGIMKVPGKEKEKK